MAEELDPARDPSPRETGKREEADRGKLLTINEAARLSHVTRQAIYVAIKQKKLRAFKQTARWNIHLDDLEDYRLLRYSRSHSVYGGDLLFDNMQGFYSIAQTAQMLHLSAQRIYHATRIKRLKAGRKGAAWIIHIDDIRQFYDKHLKANCNNTCQE